MVFIFFYNDAWKINDLLEFKVSRFVGASSQHDGINISCTIDENTSYMLDIYVHSIDNHKFVLRQNETSIWFINE